MSLIERCRELPPERFAHVLIRIAYAMQPLPCAVINSRTTLKPEENTESEQELVVPAVLIVRILELEALIPIVIVKEGDKEATGFAMRG
jgi:hypothetical protein